MATEILIESTKNENKNRLFKFKSTLTPALTGVAQWVGHHPTKQKVTVGAHTGGSPTMLLSHINVPLPLSPSFPLPLKNKLLKNTL